jgi:hypothetical protein
VALAFGEFGEEAVVVSDSGLAGWPEQRRRGVPRKVSSTSDPFFF